MLFRREGVYASLNKVIKAYSHHFPHLLCSVVTTLKKNQKIIKQNLFSTDRAELGQITEILYSRGKSHKIKPTMFKYFPPLRYSVGAGSLSYVPVTSSEV